jgi:hypothetical protein
VVWLAGIGALFGSWTDHNGFCRISPVLIETGDQGVWMTSRGGSDVEILDPVVMGGVRRDELW